MEYRSFVDLPFYKESIEEAQKLSISSREDTFLYNLWPDKVRIFGFKTKKFTMSRFLFLDKINHPCLSGDYSRANCLGFLNYIIDSKLPRFLIELIILDKARKEAKLNKISGASGATIEEVLEECVHDYVESQTVDVAGKWSLGGKKQSNMIENQVSQQYYIMSFSCLIMECFPAYTIDMLMNEVNMAVFFQLYQQARINKDPRYNIDSPVDYVNRKYLSIFNKLKKLEKEEAEQTKSAKQAEQTKQAD